MDRHPDVEIFQPISCTLGEGPVWHARRRTLWWLDIDGKRCFEAELSGEPARVVPCAQKTGAIAPTRDGGLIAAMEAGIYLMDPETGAARPFTAIPSHDPAKVRFNDAKVDPQGRFWAGSMARDETGTLGRLYRIDPDGGTAVHREGIAISNGLAWSPDGRTLYYIDSPTKIVQAFDFDPERGTLGTPRTAITLGDGDGWPDGCSMDVEGNLWIGHWAAAKLTRWDPVRGRLLRTVSLPVNNVTSCAFGGPRLEQLFITTAKDSARQEPEAGYLFLMDPGVAGVPVAVFGAGQ